MFDLSFFELMVIGVVALIVVGPERLPKVARTAGHLIGRAQRFVASVKSDISQEIQAEELKKLGTEFRQSVESVAQSVEQEATVVDDFLRKETSHVDRVLGAIGSLEGDRPVTREAYRALVETASPDAPQPLATDTTPDPDQASAPSPQQALPLDEPEQGAPAPRTEHAA